jgi:hypothetical protein
VKFTGFQFHQVATQLFVMWPMVRMMMVHFMVVACFMRMSLRHREPDKC